MESVDDGFKEMALAWWNKVNNKEPTNSSINALGHEMRRCTKVGEALISAAFYDFFHSVVPDATKREQILKSDYRLAGIARAAIVVGAIREVELKDGKNRYVSFGTQMARPRNDRPTVSRNTARQLFQTSDPDAALELILSIIHMLDDCANLKGLAWDMVKWNQKVREHMARDYFEAVATFSSANPS